MQAVTINELLRGPLRNDRRTDRSRQSPWDIYGQSKFRRAEDQNLAKRGGMVRGLRRHLQPGKAGCSNPRWCRYHAGFQVEGLARQHHVFARKYLICRIRILRAKRCDFPLFDPNCKSSAKRSQNAGLVNRRLALFCTFLHCIVRMDVREASSGPRRARPVRPLPSASRPGRTGRRNMVRVEDL